MDEPPGQMSQQAYCLTSAYSAILFESTADILKRRRKKLILHLLMDDLGLQAIFDVSHTKSDENRLTRLTELLYVGR